MLGIRHLRRLSPSLYLARFHPILLNEAPLWLSCSVQKKVPLVIQPLNSLPGLSHPLRRDALQVLRGRRLAILQVRALAFCANHLIEIQILRRGREVTTHHGRVILAAGRHEIVQALLLRAMLVGLQRASPVGERL